MRALFSSILAAVLAASPAAAGGRHGDDDAPIASVPSLDIGRYAGLWYEIARFPNRFERGCVAVTADYSLLENGDVSVRNSCRKGALDGPLEVAEGRARVEGPGRLSVNFVWFLPFIRGDYWVLDVTEDYSVAVVGEPGRDYGWVLARSPRISAAAYDRALAVLTANGYDTAALERVVQP
ncbi:lipocalin family protein [Pararhodobacter sp.]